MTKVLIIEDERLAAEKLERMVSRVRPEWTVLGTVETVEHATKWLDSNPAPDLILMDIQLADGISFEIFERVEVKSPVIFTTAFDEYAIRAFKVNSIDYLLKPIDPDALETALKKFERITPSFIPDTRLIEQTFIQMGQTRKTRFLVKVGANYHSILTRDIEMFYISERSVFIHTFQGKTYDLDYSLEQLQQIVDRDLFFRINRNVMVNIEAVSKLVTYSSNRLKLVIQSGFNVDDLIVSRDKVSNFKRWMDR